MSQHSGKNGIRLRIVTHDTEYAGVDTDLATGKCEGIWRVIFENNELPFGIGDNDDFFEPISNTLHGLGIAWICADHLLALHFLKLPDAVAAHDFVWRAHSNFALIIYHRSVGARLENQGGEGNESGKAVFQSP